MNAALAGATAAAPAAPWIAVTGAKGGVGKTVFAVNLALLLARGGQRPLLCDFDPGCGNVDVHLRLPRTHSLEDVALGRCPAAAAVVDGPAGLRVLAGRSGDTRLSADPALLQLAIAAVGRLAASHDVVVCDTGAGIGPAVLQVAARADLLLTVTTSDPAAVTDTYALAKVLHGRGHALPRLIVNGVHRREEALRTAARLGGVSRRFLGTDFPLLGWLRHDPALARSIVEQRPLALHGEGHAADDLRALVAATRSALPPLPATAARAVCRLQPRP